MYWYQDPVQVVTVVLIIIGGGYALVKLAGAILRGL